MRNKAQSVKIILICIIILVLLTLVSKTIFNLQLCKITTTQCVNSKLLEYNFKYTAYVNAAQTTNVIANDNENIIQIYVNLGDELVTGDAVLKVDIGTWQAQLLQLQANIQQQKNTISALTCTQEEKLVYEKQLQASQIEYTTLLKKYPADGIIRAEKNGEITYIANLGAIVSGQPYFTIQEQTDNAQTSIIQWNMTPQEISKISLDKADITATYYCQKTDNEFLVEKTISNVDIYECTYYPQENNYIVKGKITGQNKPNIGQEVEIGIQYFSFCANSVVPIECIKKDPTDNKDVIYFVTQKKTMWGLKYTVSKQQVTIIENNGIYAALDTYIPQNDILLSSSDEIKDDMQVQVIKNE